MKHILPLLALVPLFTSCLVAAVGAGVAAGYIINQQVLPGNVHQAEVAFDVNERTENIGARRLHTVMERLLDAVSFEASDRTEATITIDAKYVDASLGELVRDQDLTRYIL